MPPERAAPRVAVVVVGPKRVGKRVLALALGALPGHSSSGDGDDGDIFAWRETDATLRILHDTRQLAAFDRSKYSDRESDRRSQVMVAIVAFDLTRKESFEAALTQWSFVTREDSSTLTLLVGTKLDLLHEREVLYEEANQVAEMQFGAYVEVNAMQAPFTGVDEIQRLLSKWTGVPFYSTRDHRVEEPAQLLSQTPPREVRAVRSSSCSSTSSPIVPEADTEDLRLSPKCKPCIRASVWLYDPTEDHPLSPEHDVKLRPISRALFEIRGAGQEKMKSIAKYKDREVNKLMQRSKYYGPTESSRHMRWQEEQKKTKQPTGASFGHVRPRSASQGANVGIGGYNRHRDHKLLDPKSFVQTTESLRQRKLELMAKKALLAAGSKSSSSNRSAHSTNCTRSLANPHLARDDAQLQKRTKKHATTKLSSVPEEERGACDVWIPDMQSCSIGSSPRGIADTKMRPELSVDTEAPATTAAEAYSMDLISPYASHEVGLPVPTALLEPPIPPATTSPPRFSPSKHRTSSFSCVPSPSAFDFELSDEPCADDAEAFDATWGEKTVIKGGDDDTVVAT